jgi:asparaginyl-tRNA synthetase
MQRLKVVEALKHGQIGAEVDIRGWIRTKRESKQGLAFLEINDGSCLANIQIILEGTLTDFDTLVRQLSTGASCRVIGELKESPGKGQRVEVLAKSVEIYGGADPQTYPMQKKRHSFEFLREIGHLRTRTNTFGAVFRVRNALCRAIHNFFQSRGFMYVQTPIITTSDCEGAGEMFQVTTIDLAKLAQATGQREIDYSQDFFGKKASLTVSGQLEGEIFATSLGDCYTFGPTFRAENSNTTRHLAEFWMVEPEMPFYELADNMALAESFIRTILSDVLRDCEEDMAFFAERIDNTVLDTARNIIDHEFIRLPYTEAIELLLQADHKFEYPVSWGIDLQSEHERYLTEQKFKQPIILYDYPRMIKPFYMRCNEDGKTVRAMDVLVPRVGEIIGGSQREERLDILEQRMAECHLNPQDYWWYVDLRRYGSVPHSGFGLGLERTMLLLTGMANIRDVIPFPRTPKNADF